MLMNLRNALMAGKRMPTAKDYVQNGLVAMWDGIENAGWGVHDPNATTWKDLVGGIVLNGQSNPQWTDQSFAGNGAGYFYAANNTISQIIQSGVYTVEIHCGGNAGNSNGGLLAIGGGADFGSAENRQFWIWERNSNRYTEYIDACQTSQGDYDFRPYTVFGEKYTFSAAVIDASSRVGYVNAVSRITATAATSSRNGGHIFIGRLPTFGLTKSKVFCVRVYSRALSVNEIARNYEVETARFTEPL